MEERGEEKQKERNKERNSHMSYLVSLSSSYRNPEFFILILVFLLSSTFGDQKSGKEIVLFLARARSHSSPRGFSCIFCFTQDLIQAINQLLLCLYLCVSEKVATDSWENLPIFIMNCKRRNERMGHYHFSVLFCLRPE